MRWVINFHHATKGVENLFLENGFWSAKRGRGEEAIASSEKEERAHGSRLWYSQPASDSKFWEKGIGLRSGRTWTFLARYSKCLPDDRFYCSEWVLLRRILYSEEEGVYSLIQFNSKFDRKYNRIRSTSIWRELGKKRNFNQNKHVFKDKGLCGASVPRETLWRKCPGFESIVAQTSQIQIHHGAIFRAKIDHDAKVPVPNAPWRKCPKIKFVTTQTFWVQNRYLHGAKRANLDSM